MEKTVTFTMTESQAKNFEKLLDEFNAVAKRYANDRFDREKGNSKLEAETSLLLAQAKEELKKIKQINASREKMIWEQ